MYCYGKPILLFHYLHILPLPLVPEQFFIGRQFFCRGFYLCCGFDPLQSIFPTFFSLVDLMVMVPSFLQFLKALPPICVVPVPMVALLSFVHPSKADVPIVFTLFPTSTLVTFLFFLKALLAMAVTLKLFPPSFTVFGTFTFVTFLSANPVIDTVDAPVTLYWYAPALWDVPFFTVIVKVFVTVPL